MPCREDVVTFHDDAPPPPGESPWVPGVGPALSVEVVEPDPTWPDWFDDLAGRIREALGWRAIAVEHVGSTSVPGLPAKPIIDIDLTVADPNEEGAYVPALEEVGFELRVREPWWFGHRLLRATDPNCHLHVFGFDSPELVKHKIFRDWLRGNRAEVDLYARIKREAAAASTAAGEHSMQYNARKQHVILEMACLPFSGEGTL
jgi:GrpB-like predicted nucleotidyltransferase (UPF0157 family)